LGDDECLPEVEAWKGGHPRWREGGEVEEGHADENGGLLPGQVVDHAPDVSVVGDLR
jgi:hypothetical protein